MCYRDRAFCNARCDTTWCDRNFTDEQRARADKWWAGWKIDRPCPIQFKPLHVRCVEYRPPEGRPHPEGVDNRRLHDKVAS